jgi:toxin ParE1/3/4
MGYKVIWTDEAIVDHREVVAFISRDNPTAAVKLGEALIQKSRILAEHPRLGRTMRRSPSDSVLELIVRPYRIVYEIDDQGLAIRIRMPWHGARQEPEIQ